MITFTEKDKKILDYIAEYGGIYVEDTKGIYSESQYYRRRIKKLMDENFLLRKNKILYFGAKGKQYFETQGKEYRNIGTDIKLRKRAAEMFSLFNKLQDFTIVPSFKMDRITKNFAYRYYGKAINKTEKEYWIYRIGKVDLKENDDEGNARKLKGKELDVLRTKNEITEIRDSSSDMKAMIFIEDSPSMNIYKDLAGSVNIGEHILMPYTKSGLALVNKYVGKAEGDNEIILKQLHSRGFNAKFGHSSCNTADFDIDGSFGINLTTSDYNKEIRLNNYLGLTRQSENVIIICSSTQERKYRNIYKGYKLIIVD
jgi:hypothetical protein